MDNGGAWSAQDFLRIHHVREELVEGYAALFEENSIDQFRSVGSLPLLAKTYCFQPAVPNVVDRSLIGPRCARPVFKISLRLLLCAQFIQHWALQQG